jgi:hypothetical protein
VLIGREGFSTFIRRESFKFCRILFLNTGLRVVPKHCRPARSNDVPLPKHRVVKAYKWCSDISNLGIRKKWVVRSFIRSPYTHGKDLQYPSDRRLGWPHNKSAGRKQKFFIYRESNSGQSLHGLHNTLSYIQTNKLKCDVTVNMKVIFDIVYRLEFFQTRRFGNWICFHIQL